MRQWTRDNCSTCVLLVWGYVHSSQSQEKPHCTSIERAWDLFDFFYFLLYARLLLAWRWDLLETWWLVAILLGRLNKFVLFRFKTLLTFSLREVFFLMSLAILLDTSIDFGRLGLELFGSGWLFNRSRAISHERFEATKKVHWEMHAKPMRFTNQFLSPLHERFIFDKQLIQLLFTHTSNLHDKSLLQFS